MKSYHLEVALSKVLSLQPILPEDFMNNELYLMTKKLQNQLNEVIENRELSPLQVAQIDSIRSELDTIGVSLLLIEVKEKFDDVELKFNQRIDQVKVDLLKEIENYHVTNLIEQEERFRLLAGNNLYLQNHGRISDSLIINDDWKTDKMLLFFSQSGKILGYPKLLYRATRDGFQASFFHNKCDGKPNTITIIKSSNDKIFGGYTSAKWDTSKTYKEDTTAWLFNINADHIFRFNHQTASSKSAIYCQLEYGPTFGAHNLYIAEKPNINMNSNVNVMDTYSIPNNNNLFLVPGKENFQVAEIEVYQI